MDHDVTFHDYTPADQVILDCQRYHEPLVASSTGQGCAPQVVCDRAWRDAYCSLHKQFAFKLPPVTDS